MKTCLHKALIAFFLLGFFQANTQTIYVNSAAAGANDGSSWANAYKKLDAALGAATTAGRQIWVAKGTYVPDSTFGFVMNPGVQLYGGFAGTETALTQRNAAANVTILSGDKAGDDVPFDFVNKRADNATHVLWLRGADTISRAVIDGFTVRGGNTKPTTATVDLDKRGGGFLVLAKATVRNCLFTDNAGVSGAALAAPSAEASAILIDNCIFERNSTPERSTVHLRNLRSGEVNRSIFRNNFAARGILYAETSKSILFDSCLVDNNKNITSGATATLGAGIYLIGSAARVTNCITRRNKASDGAGAYISSNADTSAIVRMDNCLFELDTALANGGGIRAQGVLAIATNCIFRSNTATTRGNAIFVGGGTQMAFRNCLIEKNIGANSIWLQNANTVALFEDCTISDNKSGGSGGVFLNLAEASLIVRKCKIERNEGSAGGVAFTQGTNTAAPTVSQTISIFEDCTVSANKSVTTSAGATGRGGFAFVGFRGQMIVNRCIVEKNNAETLGGAFILQNDSTKITITNSRFVENKAGSSGGVLTTLSGPEILIQGSTFSGNSGDFGGVLAINSSKADQTDITVNRCLFDQNIAVTQGGAINIDNVPNFYITNSIFSNNIGENGGVISNNASGTDTSRVHLINCTMAGNTGTSASCVVQYEEKTDTSEAILRMVNTIFATNDGDNYAVEAGKPTVVSGGGNLSQDASMLQLLKGTNDLNGVDPKMINQDAGDYRLAAGSPCIDKGVTGPGIPTVDFNGFKRDAKPDMGAYEFGAVGVFTAPEVLQIQLTPNPAADFVTLRFDDDSKGQAYIECFNALGALVHSQMTEKTAGEWQQRIEVAQWPVGVYQLRVRVGAKTFGASMVKE